MNALSPSDLASFITAEVARQSGEEAIRTLVEKKIGDCIREAVENSMRGYGDIGQQIKKAVSQSLQLPEPLDVPAYGNMVLAVLRQKMDEILTPIVNERLATEMTEILSTAPAEVKLSAIIEAMKEDENESERYGTHATVIIEESENVPGYRTVYLDPGDLKDRTYRTRTKYECEVRFSVTDDGKVFSLHVDQKDAKTTIRMGHLPRYQKMVFAAYACGGKVIVDGDEGYFDTGYGDI